MRVHADHFTPEYQLTLKFIYLLGWQNTSGKFQKLHV